MIKKGLLLLVVILANSCSKDSENPNTTTPDSNTPEVSLSTAKELTSFTFTIDAVVYETEIRNDSVITILPSSIDLTQLAPEIIISNKASVSPASGITRDFSNVLTYEVTAEDNSSKIYKAVITKENSEKSITSFLFTNLAEGQSGYSIRNNNLEDIDTLSFSVPYLSPIKGLTSNISVSTNAIISPDTGETLDYTSPVNYTVTAEDGTKKEYMVIVDNSLPQIKINSILGNTYRNIGPGESVSFFANSLNPIQDSIQVSLLSIDGLTELNLPLENVNYDTNEVRVLLPETYVNDNFRFKVFIEHDNFDESNGFTLDGGTPDFKFIQDYFNNSEYINYTTLLLPGERFTAGIFVNIDNFDLHEFYLRKNNQDFPLRNVQRDMNFNAARFEMPSIPITMLDGGLDFEFLIKYEGQEYVFPITNSLGNPIEILVAEPPIISSISNTTIVKGEEFAIFGENLLYPYFGGDTNSPRILRSDSRVFFKTAAGSSYEVAASTINGNGSMTVKAPECLKSGTYNLAFENNIQLFDQLETGMVVTIELPESNHPTINVTEAKIYRNTNTFTPKQVLLTFNGDISGFDFDRIEIQNIICSEPIIIENFFVNTNTILTGGLSDEDYSYVNTRLPDGFVIFEDQGVEYKVWFKISRE